MRTTVALLIALAGATPVSAQPNLDVVYGFDRNVASSADSDGWMGAVVEWPSALGVRVGFGASIHVEGATPTPSEIQSGALFVSVSRVFTDGPVRPFFRGGIGMGPAPCESDTCGDGLHVRGSGGVRIGLDPSWSVVAEGGLSRVSRPFAGIGISWGR